MKLIQFTIAWMFVLALTGCSAVPGDAALRAGHTQQAEELYISGAERGNPASALRLAFLIEQREGNNPNSAAGRWFKRACDLGSVVGCHNAAVGYETGTSGLIKDYAEAQSLYLQTARKGLMQSQYNLARMHAQNFISPADDIEGLKWIILAQNSASQCKDKELSCRRILEDSPGHKSKLTSRLSSEQQQRAETLAAAWKPLQQ